MIVFSKPPDAPPPPVTVEVDERWLGEWIEYGFVEISKSLGNHAAFDAYYENRGAE